MRKRNRGVLLWLTEKEYENFEKDAEKCGLSKQEYLRKLLGNIRPKELPPHEYFEMLKELGRIGNNLNQIAMVANTKGFIDTESYWENARQLQASVGKIRDGVW